MVGCQHTFNGVATAQSKGFVQVPDGPQHEGPSAVLVHLDAAPVTICICMHTQQQEQQQQLAAHQLDHTPTASGWVVCHLQQHSTAALWPQYLATVFDDDAEHFLAAEQAASLRQAQHTAHTHTWVLGDLCDEQVVDSCWHIQPGGVEGRHILAQELRLKVTHPPVHTARQTAAQDGMSASMVRPRCPNTPATTLLLLNTQCYDSHRLLLSRPSWRRHIRLRLECSLVCASKQS